MTMRYQYQSRSPRGYRAFTLIEILVAFAIFSMVLTAIYATWTLIIKSAKIGQESAAQIQRERIAMRTMKEALAGVVSFQADQDNYAFIAENGDNGTLSFAAHLPEVFPRSLWGEFIDYEVRRVSFSVEYGSEPNQPRQLVLRQTPLLKEMTRDEKEFPFVVARGVNKMELEFWDLKKSDWVEEWTRTNELPKMIKIKLEFLRQNPRQPYAPGVKQEIIDIAPLPAVMVPAAAQGNPQAGQQPGQPPVQPPGQLAPPGR